MTVYAIRHKRTQEFMPNMDKNRGYSHWNPDKPKKIKQKSEGIRILYSVRTAKAVITGWFNTPNGRNGGYQSSWDGEWIDDIDIKQDGRKKEDLEIVIFELTETGVITS